MRTFVGLDISERVYITLLSATQMPTFSEMKYYYKYIHRVYTLMHVEFFFFLKKTNFYEQF